MQKRRRILSGLATVLSAGLLAGCTGNEPKEGYLQAETRDDIPADAEVVQFETVDWENKAMVEQIVKGAYASGTSSMSVQGDEYQEAKKQLNLLDSDYVKYNNITIVVYLATEDS